MEWWEKLIIIVLIGRGFQSVVKAVNRGFQEVQEKCLGAECKNCGERHHYSQWQCEKEEKEKEIELEYNSILPDHYWDGSIDEK